MLLESAARNAAMNAVTGLLDSGNLLFATDSSGTTTVGEVTLHSTAFASASSGTAAMDTANATDETSATAGTIGWCLVRNSSDSTIITLTAGTATTNDLTLTSATVGGGDSISVTSLIFTQPAS